jgi:DNA-directed RNA polymerase specialized sigma24 family protein
MAKNIRILAYYNRKLLKKAPMTLEEALHTHDMEEIMNSMTAYVYSRIKTIGVKDLGGKTPYDFVGEVLLKVLEGDRDWSKAKCPFKEFLFGCLKSHLDNFFKSYRQVYNDELPEIQVAEVIGDGSESKNAVIEMFKKDGADTDEIDVFECWIDGIRKPAEIADLCGIKINDVYNITKRLERRRLKILPQITRIL